MSVYKLIHKNLNAASTNFYPVQHVVMIRPNISDGNEDHEFLCNAYAFHKFGYKVTIVTCSQNPPIRDLKDFHTISTGTMIPISILGSFKYLMYVIRSMWITIRCMFIQAPKPSIIFSNSSCIFLPLHLIGDKRIIIHVPDSCEFGHGTFTSKCQYYVKWLFKKTISYANLIIVFDNDSKENIVSLKQNDNDLRFFYPCVDVPFMKEMYIGKLENLLLSMLPDQSIVFVALGDFNPDSNFELAIIAFRKTLKKLPEQIAMKTVLLIGGRLDANNAKQVEYYEHIKLLISYEEYSLNIPVVTYLNVKIKMVLISSATAVLHTSYGYGFNSLVLEAMYLGKPVITGENNFAKHIIKNNVTGYLVKLEPEEFAAIMFKLANNKVLSIFIGDLARSEFKHNYSFLQYSKLLNQIIMQYTLECFCPLKCKYHK